MKTKSELEAKCGQLKCGQLKNGPPKSGQARAVGEQGNAVNAGTGEILSFEISSLRTVQPAEDVFFVR